MPTHNCRSAPADLPACPRLVAPAPALMGTALLLSHLLTRALAERPFAASDAPAWFESVARLVRSKLQVRLFGPVCTACLLCCAAALGAARLD